MMKAKTLILSIFLAIAGATTTAYGDAAGTSDAIRDAQDPEKTAAFTAAMQNVVNDIKKDSKYKAIPLGAKKDQDWFTTQSFLLWDDKISKSEFVKTGLEKFPSHEYEFNFVADRLSK